jgi:DNA replication and repair protein RecF
MQVKKLTLQNFRCFTSKTLEISSNQFVIEGRNGAGKSSVLEALNYGCYAQSFRTKRSEELVKEDAGYFYIEIEVADEAGTTNSIQIGYNKNNEKAGSCRTIKLNGKVVKSHKEIMRHYKAVTLSEGDLELVQSYPEKRRTFLNQSLFLNNQSWISEFRTYKKILTQRNQFLSNISKGISKAEDGLETWSKQLWNLSRKIQNAREVELEKINKSTNNLLEKYFSSDKLFASFKYERKEIQKSEDFKAFWAKHIAKNLNREIGAKRSMFGAHLDDFKIEIHGRCARTFASRGEQKLLTFLMKCAQLLTSNEEGKMLDSKGILLLDDFLTDLDPERLKKSLIMLENLKVQSIITTPIEWSKINNNNANRITL